MIRLLTFLPIASALASGTSEPLPISLSELASNADIVAIAQVRDTDYVYARAFPNEGSAYLKILIPYKLEQRSEEIIEVYEKGLHRYECYFENPTVFEEGRRYLVFLARDEQDPERYRGLPQGCAFEVLVTQDNTYALKYPPDDVAITDALGELAVKFEFRDKYALFDDETLSPGERNRLLEAGWITPYKDGYKYTHGVDLTLARRLIDPEALKP